MSGEKSSSEGRRDFLKYVVTAVVCGVVAGVGGYFGGAAAVPPPKTVTETVTETAAAETVTVTGPAKTVTETVTVTKTPTPTLTPPPGKTEVIIGVIGPLATLIGRSEEKAAKLAVEEINAKGGILGLPLKLTVGDTKLKPDEAVAELRRLVTVEKADMLTGGFSSGVMLAMMEAMAELKIPLYSDCSSPRHSAKVAENYEKYKYWFRMQTNGYTFAWDLADLLDMLEEKGVDVSEIYVIRDEHIWVDDVEAFFNPLLEKRGITVVKNVKVPRGYTEYEPLLLEAHDLGAKVVVPIVAISGTGDILVKHWARLKLPTLLAGHDLIAMDPAFWEKTEGAANYSTYVASGGALPSVALTDTGEKFIKNYKIKYGVYPEQEQAFEVYDAIYLYKTVVEKAAMEGIENPFDPDVVVEYTEKYTRDNPIVLTRVIAFHPPGTTIQGVRWDHEVVWGEDFMRNWIFQWQDGKPYIVRGKLKTRELKLPPWLQ